MFARVVNLVLLTALVIAIPLSHVALSKKKAPKKNGDPPPKVAICHFPDDQPGHVIVVSENAVAMHIAKHGDCTAFVVLDTGECLCLTCQELCAAVRDRCRADCPSLTCVGECEQAFQQCLLGCNAIGGGG